MELNTFKKALLEIISQCSVKEVNKFQELYLMVKEKGWWSIHFGHLGEMSIGEMSVGEMCIGEMCIGEMSGYHVLHCNIMCVVVCFIEVNSHAFCVFQGQ